MNASSIKTVLVLAVLGAVGYGVYIKLNNSPAPPKAVDGWTSLPPKIELPGAGSTTPTFPGGVKEVDSGSGATVTNPFAPNGSAADPKEVAPSRTNPTPLPSYPGKPEMATNNGRPSGGAFPAGNSVPWPSPNVPLPTAGAEGVPSQPKNGGSTLPGTAPGSAVASDRPEEDVRRAFAALMDSVMAKLNKGELAEAHLVLSEWYGDPRLPPDQARQLAELLSQLAGTVIYSRQSFLERPYIVQSGDTLEKIGQAYNVPWQMLAKINNIHNPADVQPGQELKVVRGPFNAIVDLNRYELVLMLDGRYAGRFAIGIGRDCPPLEPQYVVRDKQFAPPSSGSNPSRNATNPAVNRWIELGSGLGIHGTNAPQNIGHTDGQGAIFMAERDIEDLYDILTAGTNGSNGSTVIIRR